MRTTLLATKNLECVSVRGDGRETVVRNHAHQDYSVLDVKKNVHREVMATERVIMLLVNTHVDQGTLESHVSIHVHWEHMAKTV